MIVWIDTSDDQSITVGLIDKKIAIAWRRVPAFRRQAEKLLPALEQLLKATKHSWRQVTGVAVHPGPGSFTAVRIGVATANALGYSQDIPIVAVAVPAESSPELIIKKVTQALAKTKRFRPVRPRYDREPNITYSKT